MTELTHLTCPTCGATLPFEKEMLRVLCPHCSGEHITKRSGRIVFLKPVEVELQQIQEAGEKTAALVAIKKLNAEIKNLQIELFELSNEGTPIETVRSIGFTVIALGLLFSVVYGISTFSIFPMAAASIVMGIVLHGSTGLIGKDYYIRKAYLNELINRKRTEVLRYEKHLLN